MLITGLHLLLTYQCTFECDHCFVWGSPEQTGTMTIEQIRGILEKGQQAGTVTSIYFEGGEPFLYYATLLEGTRLAVQKGFKVGIVSNSFWATSKEDALAALRPFAGLLDDLSISGDLFHSSEAVSLQNQNAKAAAKELGIPIGFISIARPDEKTSSSNGQLPIGQSGVMYRGRAAFKLASSVPLVAWTELTACPHEDLRDPGRIHVDPYGNLHICQGIVIGNIFTQSLGEICASFQPELHPVLGPLLEGGPAALMQHYHLQHAQGYADACHLCYEARRELRSSYPAELTPDQMYGIATASTTK